MKNKLLQVFRLFLILAQMLFSGLELIFFPQDCRVKKNKSKQPPKNNINTAIKSLVFRAYEINLN